MSDNQLVESIQNKYESLLPYLNEKTRRIWAAIGARSLRWGGSNGYRTRLWKLKLQELATEIGKTIHVCHFRGWHK
jgi:Rhodopirellula transposase DDE domain